MYSGMSGAFTTSPLPGKPPTPTTRLLLVNEELDLTASLSAMTVVHGGLELYEVSCQFKVLACVEGFGK